MYEEFEKIAGYEVSFEDYNNIIEPMYMALPNVSKQDFVKMIDKKRFALPTKKQMIDSMKKIAQHLHDTCERYTDYKAYDELEKIARDYAKRFHHITNEDGKGYVILHREYYFEEIQRGCTYPKQLIIGSGLYEYERITLVK